MQHSLLKFLISIFVGAMDWVWERVISVLGRKTSAVAVVLVYHGIIPEHRQLFARQMDRLLTIAQPISADHSTALEKGCRYVAVTFDNGYESMFDSAWPELKIRGIPVTIFVVSGCLGLYPSWAIGDVPLEGVAHVISKERLCNMVKNPLITVGSHSITHRDFSDLTNEEILKELALSKLSLEELLCRQVNLFAFPRGVFEQRHLTLAKEAGYERVFSASQGLALRNPGEYLSARVPVEPGDSMLAFDLKVRGAYRWVPAVSAVKSAIGRTRVRFVAAARRLSSKTRSE